MIPFAGFNQDIHFSQLTRANFLLNPAFTGTFSGNFRATMNWKDQWQSINKTFRTYASSAEFSFGKRRPKHPTFYAIGFYAAKDVAGDVELGTTTLGGTFSSIFQISRNQRFSVGLQGGYGKSGISTSNMQWGSQYSGLNFDPSLYDGEGIDYFPQQYWDLSGGISWWYHKNDRNVAFGAPQDARIGLAVYHINRPDIGFVVGEEVRTPMRAVLHASALLPTPLMDLYWFPNITAQMQGKQSEVVFGALAKYTLKSGSKMTGYGMDVAISGGVNFRVNNVFDAVIPQIFLDIQSFSFGMSYDINTSRLNAASSYRGGFELSLRFTNFDNYTHKNPYRRGVNI